MIAWSLLALGCNNIHEKDIVSNTTVKQSYIKIEFLSIDVEVRSRNIG